MTDCKTEWEASYLRRENFVFYPNEEVIRFVSRFIRKRIGIDEFRDVTAGLPPRPTMLDLGCGIGRHLVYGAEMNFDVHGIDLSAEAVAAARRRLGTILPDAAARVVAGSSAQLPWSDDFFDLAVCHGVLDSMQFDAALASIAEVRRVLKPGGLFYCDLISGDETGRPPDFAGEVVVEREHERGTIQSYFNRAQIERISKGFDVLDCVLIRRADVLKNRHKGRWHVVLRSTRA
jgi:ubiquinone/menaquinone biosynthesis C-methylase UbiE